MRGIRDGTEEANEDQSMLKTLDLTQGCWEPFEGFKESGWHE